MTDILSYNTFVHAVAGAIGGLSALAIFYPLDLARTRLQVDTLQKSRHTHQFILSIVREEGFRALFSGCLPVLTSQCCSNFVYFYAYAALKRLVLGGSSTSNPILDLLCAYVAAVINVLTTNPLWVANTRLRLQGVKLKTDEYRKKQERYTGMMNALMIIASSEGIGALWNGTVPSIILAANPSIHIMFYEAFKRYFQILFGTKDLSGVMYFVIGAMAKLISTLLTYPLQVFQSQLRTGYEKGKKQRGIFELLYSNVRDHGLISVYKGLETKLIQTVLTAAMMFMVYEKIVYFVFYMMGLSSITQNKMS